MPRGKRKNPNLNQQIVEFDAEGNQIAKPRFFGESFASEDRSILTASRDFPNRLQLNNPGTFSPAWERYEQIYKGVMPFNMATNSIGTFIDIQQIVELCQKAYFNVSIFRNTIDMMTEFANSEIFFKGGNEKSRKLFHNWFYNKIGGYNLVDQCFREWFRSGTIALYRFDADVSPDILKKIGNMYGTSDKSKTSMKLPVKYLLINPAFLRVDYGLNFSNQNYYKVLTNYELARLKNPITEEEKEFANSLPREVKKSLEDRGNMAVFPLDSKNTYVISCKKQDYEPFAMPMFFTVLEDIDLKLSFKRTEKILSRTVEYVNLLINVGTEDNPNPAALNALQELFSNETIGRVLVADGTTKMEFVIPDLNKVIGPDKYKVVNDDIAYGLMNIFYGEEKFSATNVKIKVFMERLNEARRSFLELFLNPEIKRIAQNLGLKSYPHAEFATVDLNDHSVTNKLYAQLYQLGALTNEELVQAIDTGYLPTPEESEESQLRFKALRDKGCYEPLIGGGDNLSVDNGKPVGEKSPSTSKKPSPAGSKSKASINDFNGFELNKITEMFKTVNEIFSSLQKEAKNHFNVKKLNKKQEDILNSLVPIILSNESPNNWKEVCGEYIKNPKPINEEAAQELDKISAEFDTSLLLSAILRHCKK